MPGGTGYTSAVPDDPLAALHAGPRLPAATARDLAARPDLAPRLDALLRDDAAWDADDWAVVHATLLLAAMKPPGLLESLVHALDAAERHGIQPLLEEFPHLFATLGRDAIPRLAALSLDSTVALYVRTAANDGLTRIALNDAAARPEVASHLRSVLADDGLELDNEGLIVQEEAAMNLLFFAEARDRKRLEQHLAELLDEDQLDEAVAGVPPWTADPARSPLDFYDRDDLESLDLHFVEEVEDDDLDDGGEEPPPQELFTLPPAGPGRNDPCPCGSGKKFKKCCGK